MTYTDNHLRLRPLNAAELALSLENYSELEQALGLNVTSTTTLLDDEEMRYALRVRHAKVLQDEENYCWLTMWAIIHREQQQLIGFLILKGPRTSKGRSSLVMSWTRDTGARAMPQKRCGRSPPGSSAIPAHAGSLQIPRRITSPPTVSCSTWVRSCTGKPRICSGGELLGQPVADGDELGGCPAGTISCGR